MILTIVRKKFSSTTFKSIKPPHQNRPYRNLRLIGLPQNLTPFWQALLVPPRHSCTQTCIGVWEVCSLWARDPGEWCAWEPFALVEGEYSQISLLKVVKKSIIGSSTRISHHRTHGPRFPGYSRGHGISWAPILEVSSSLHRPALNSEGENSHGGYVHQRVAAGGSYEVGLSARWV
jgi:hypothetical protein